MSVNQEYLTIIVIYHEMFIIAKKNLFGLFKLIIKIDKNQVDYYIVWKIKYKTGTRNPWNTFYIFNTERSIKQNKINKALEFEVTNSVLSQETWFKGTQNPTIRPYPSGFNLVLSLHTSVHFNIIPLCKLTY